MVVLLSALALTVAIYLPSLWASPAYEDAVYDTPPAQTEAHSLNLMRPRSLSEWTFRLQAGHLRVAHVTQIVVLLLCGLLIAGILEPMHPWAAVGAASLFLVHGLNTEAVASLAYRADLLMLAAVLFAVWAMTWRRGVALGVLVGALVAVWAKESGVVCVPLVALWSATTGRRMSWWWLVALAGAALSAVAMTCWLLPHMSRWTAPAPHGWFWFVAIQCVAIWRYLALTVWPDTLSIDHDFEVGPLAAFVALLLLCAVLIPIAARWRRHPALVCGVGGVLIWLAPHLLVPLPDYLKEHHWPLAWICLSIWRTFA